MLSPFFQSLPLSRYGLQWIIPPVMLAHPLDDGPAVCVHGSVAQTAQGLEGDGAAYQRLLNPLIDSWPKIADSVLGPLRWPRHPLALARFGVRALQPALTLAHRTFPGTRGRAVFSGMAAHSMLPLEAHPTGGIALVLALAAHVGGWCLPGVARNGWPMPWRRTCAPSAAKSSRRPRSGPSTSCRRRRPSSAIYRRGRCFSSPVTDSRRGSVARLRAIDTVWVRTRLTRALDGPIPWADTSCALAATVHLGGTLEEVAASAPDLQGGHPDRPFVLISQPTLFPSFPAPHGRHIAWGYCHVPHGVENGDAPAHRAANREICAGLSRPHPGSSPYDLLSSSSDTIQTSSAATLPAARRRLASCLPVLRGAPIRRRFEACTSAQRQRRQA